MDITVIKYKKLFDLPLNWWKSPLLNSINSLHGPANNLYTTLDYIMVLDTLITFGLITELFEPSMGQSLWQFRIFILRCVPNLGPNFTICLCQFIFSVYLFSFLWRNKNLKGCRVNIMFKPFDLTYGTKLCQSTNACVLTMNKSAKNEKRNKVQKCKFRLLIGI